MPESVLKYQKFPQLTPERVPKYQNCQQLTPEKVPKYRNCPKLMPESVLQKTKRSKVNHKKKCHKFPESITMSAQHSGICNYGKRPTFKNSV